MGRLSDRFDALWDKLGNEGAYSRESLGAGGVRGAGATGKLSRNYYGGSAGSSYRRQEQAYRRALRQLRHASRRGDTGAALREIAVRRQAEEEGFSPDGIRRLDERRADIFSRIGSREQAGADRRRAEELERRRTTGLLEEFDELDREKALGRDPREFRRDRLFDRGRGELPGVDEFSTQEARPDRTTPTLPDAPRDADNPLLPSTMPDPTGKTPAFRRSRLFNTRLV